MAHFKVLYQSLPTGRDKKHEQSYSSLTKFKTSQKLVRVLNPLMPNLNYIVFKNSLLISKKHQHGSIIKINWLMLFILITLRGGIAKSVPCTVAIF
jgi:hypothetical protein